jgi:hypothetical protein
MSLIIPEVETYCDGFYNDIDIHCAYVIDTVREFVEHKIMTGKQVFPIDAREIRDWSNLERPDFQAHGSMTRSLELALHNGQKCDWDAPGRRRMSRFLSGKRSAKSE